MKALCFDRYGGPDVLAYRDVPDPDLAPGHALVRLEAIGLNFADIYRRQGRYHLAGRAPYIAGYEGAGTIIAFDGEGPFRLGDRVAFVDSPFANAEHVAVPYDKLIALPEDISCELAAAVLLQGLTAHYLTRDSHRVSAGEKILVHAAAGGVGLLLTQMIVGAGAQVMGLTSTAEKADVVRKAGANLVALYSDDWVALARAFGNSREHSGVDVGYDSVGTTLASTLDAVRVGGQVVFYGMAGGDPPPVAPRMLMDASKTLTGGDLWNILTSAEERRMRADELFRMLRGGNLHVHIAARYALADGAQAHAYLESRQSSGKILLIP